MHRRRVLADRITYVGLDVHKDGIGVLEASRRGRNEFCSEPEVPSAIGTAGMPAAGMLRFERRGKVQRAAHRIDDSTAKGQINLSRTPRGRRGDHRPPPPYPKRPPVIFRFRRYTFIQLTAEQDI